MVAITKSKSELMTAVRGLSAARDLPVEVILDALEEALRSAYRKMPDGTATNVTVSIDEQTGDAHVFAHFTVVDEKYLEDAHGEMTVEQATAHKPDPAIGDSVAIDVTPHDFGRIAAQTAKQVILQKIREAEREQTFTTYAEREGEIVYGTIQSVGKEYATVSLDRVEAIFPKAGQIPGERYTANQRLRFYVSEVRRTPKGPQVVVTRTQREMLKRLMELEIPEIFQGIVEIKAMAREAGSRSKVAVWAHQEGVDPVGACVGMRGVRIQALVRELGGEKIDVVSWDPDPRVFIANALSPSKVLYVGLEEDIERRTATVIVPDSQLSLAIGREGQNARLGAKLTGWRIDIRAESEADDIMDKLRTEESAAIADRVRRQAEEASARRFAEAEAEAAAAAAIAALAAEAAKAARTAETADAVDAEPDLPSTPTVSEIRPSGAAKVAERTPAETAAKPSEPPVWVPPFPVEDEEEAEAVAPATGKKKKGKKLVLDTRTGQLVAQKEHKRKANEWVADEDWDEEVLLEDDFGFTEDDFLGSAEPDSETETEADPDADEAIEPATEAGPEPALAAKSKSDGHDDATDDVVGGAD